MPLYAEGTTVTPDRSRAEIEKTVARYGAAGFAVGYETSHAAVAFRLEDRQIRFGITYPDPGERRFTHMPSRGRRTAAQSKAAYEAEIRRLWRSLAMAIKAKLEIVASGISTIEEEFALHTVLPDGRTAAEHVLPAITTALASGEVPPMLPAMPRQITAH